ncbi:MAG TPA: MFS transporter [Terriglobales bacterium]|nr:MFS transporter [Terriglobales bacterium]
MGTSAPTRVRLGVAAFVTLVTFLTYLDRLNLSIAGKSIQEELRLSTETLGWVLSAFLLGYALLQIPGGWLGDRLGARKVLAGAVLLWSVFTVLTAFAPQLPIARWWGAVWALMIVRFLVGVGEAASSPNANKIIAAWMGSNHRGFGTSFSILGIGLGGAMTPPLIAWIMQRWGWRTSFVVAGIAGLAVALAWYWFVTDTPEEHPKVNAAELELIRSRRTQSGPADRMPALHDGQRTKAPVPWGRILRSRSVWGLALGYMCQGFPIYFFHTWFFIYLVNIRGMSVTKGSFWGSFPYVAIALLAPLGGMFSDRVSRQFGKRLGRRMAIAVGMGSSAILLFAGSHTAANLPALLMLGFGAGFNMFAATTFWATAIDLSEAHTASVSGLMNTFGNLGGWLSPIVTAYLATRHGWNAALYCAAAVSACSIAFFSLVDADESVDAATEDSYGITPPLAPGEMSF